MLKNLKNDAYLVLLISSISFIEYPSLVDYSNLPKIIFLLLVATTISFITKSSIGKLLNPKQNNYTFLLTLFIIILLYGIFYSYNPYDSIYRIAPILILSILFYQLHYIYSVRTFILKTGLLLSATCLILSISTITSIIYNGDYTHALSYTYRYSFGHRNIYSNFLILSIPIILIATTFYNKKILKIFSSFAIATNVLCVVLLMTRSSYLALIAFILMLTAGFVISYFYKKTTSLKKSLIYTTVPLVLSILLVIFSIPSIFEKISSIFTVSYGSSNERIQLWKNSISMIQENPVLGVGTGDWKIEILKYPVNTPQAISGSVYYQRVHNDYIQILAENGIIGLISYLLIFVVAIKNLIKKNSIHRSYKIYAIAGIGMFLIISFFSFPFERIELMTLLFILLFPLFSIDNSKSTKTRLTSFILIFLFSFLIIRVYNDQLLFNAKTKEFNNLPLEAEKNFLKINDHFFSLDYTSTPINWYKGNYSFQKKDFKKAEKYFTKAIKNNPYHPHVLNNLASSLFQQGEYDQAEKYFKKCRKYHPYFSDAILNYSAFLFNQGQSANALMEIVKMPVENQPQNYDFFYLAIVKQYVKDAYHLDVFYNDNQYLDMQLHCRYHKISIINELERRTRD